MSAFGAPGASPGPEAPCACGSGEPYAGCCGPMLRGLAQAPTAEALMRSRYTAYAVGNVDHIVRTWHPRHRPDTVRLDPQLTWTGLVIERTSAGGLEDERGVVEFRAHFVAEGRPGVLHEVSRFERRAGRWFYVDGDTD